MIDFDKPRLFNRHPLMIRVWFGLVCAAAGVTIAALAYALARVLFWVA